MTAEQLAELRGAAERVGDDLGAGQREGRLDPAITLGDEMRTGREEAAVELRESLEVGGVAIGGEAQSHGTLPGSLQVDPLVQVESAPRHERIMGAATIYARCSCHRIDRDLRSIHGWSFVSS